MAKLVKILDPKLDDLSLIARTHTEEGEKQFLQDYRPAHVRAQTHTK